MSKSYWMEDQTGNFSKEKEDTFDPEKRYVGIRLQQGVPLLDRDWNELEDIRRYEEVMLRKWYVGNGTPDDGFKISEVGPPAKNNFKIKAGRCIVDGFEVVNDKDILYSKQQKDVAALTPPSDGGREDTVYLDVWIEEVTSAEDSALENPRDVNIETCIRHKLEWRVKVDEGSKVYETYHHYYDLAKITWVGGKIEEVKDLRTLKLTLTSVRNELEDVRKATVNRWINGGKIDYKLDQKKYEFSIDEMLCIIGGQEINFGAAKGDVEIKEDENCVVLANGSKKEIEFIVTRRNLLEWLNSWTLDKWRLAEDTEPVLKSTFTLPLYFFERHTEGKEFKITDLRLHGVLDTWLTELASRLNARERRMCTVPLLQQTIFGRAVPVATVTVGGSPYGVAFDGAYLWVTNSSKDSVHKIDINTNEVIIPPVTVGGSPRGVAFDGVHIWVANHDEDSETKKYSVSKIDINTNLVVKTVDVGKGPYGVAFDGAHIWVTNHDEGSVSKININTNEVEKPPVTVGGSPRGVAFDGVHIWVANHDEDSETKKYSVSKIDINTNLVVKTVDVGKGPYGVAFDGAHIWVTNHDEGSVSKIDINTNNVVATVPLGGSPRGVAFDGAHIWVAISSQDRVKKIDITTNEVIATVIVENDPRGVAFDGVHIWVANYLHGNVSKILRGDLK